MGLLPKILLFMLNTSETLNFLLLIFLQYVVSSKRSLKRLFTLMKFQCKCERFLGTFTQVFNTFNTLHSDAHKLYTRFTKSYAFLGRALKAILAKILPKIAGRRKNAEFLNILKFPRSIHFVLRSRAPLAAHVRFFCAQWSFLGGSEP